MHRKRGGQISIAEGLLARSRIVRVEPQDQPSGIRTDLIGLARRGHRLHQIARIEQVLLRRRPTVELIRVGAVQRRFRDNTAGIVIRQRGSVSSRPDCD